MSQIIGRFEPFMSCHKAFDVASMEPSDSMGDPGYIGKKADGSSFHVFNKHWKWIPFWTGEGLPPVGTKVTIDKGKLRIWEESEMFIGPVVEVVSTFKLENSDMVVVYLEDENACCVFRASMCRMPKTPEQIAAEQREKGIEGIRKAVSSSPNCKAHGLEWDVAGAIYDAGYRKFEIVENEE